MSGRRNGIVVPFEAILLRPRVTFDVANEKIAVARRAARQEIYIRFLHVRIFELSPDSRHYSSNSIRREKLLLRGILINSSPQK